MRNVLVYYREDMEVGGVLDMTDVSIERPQSMGMISGTSSQVIGFNKPTAFEFVICTPGKAMRVCAFDADDEVAWRKAILETEQANQALNKLIK